MAGHTRDERRFTRGRPPVQSVIIHFTGDHATHPGRAHGRMEAAKAPIAAASGPGRGDHGQVPTRYGDRRRGAYPGRGPGGGGRAELGVIRAVDNALGQRAGLELGELGRGHGGDAVLQRVADGRGDSGLLEQAGASAPTPAAVSGGQSGPRW